LTFHLAVSWHANALAWTAELGIVLIAAGMLMCIYRLLRGPHLADRALAVDTLSVQLIGLVLLLEIVRPMAWFLDGVLVLSLLGFAGTVAMSQYIARPLLKKARGNGHKAVES